jgi:hypothetical protein
MLLRLLIALLKPFAAVELQIDKEGLHVVYRKEDKKLV